MNKVVYRHRRLDTNEIFYVGIGKTKKRAYSKHQRNPHWYNIVNKTDYSVEIIAEVDTWELACELEQLLIQEYGRKDLGLGSLVNMTDGGDGAVNLSQESIEKIREDKLGNKNPMYGKTPYNIREVICTETNKIWKSVKECAEENNILHTTLVNKLSGFRYNNTSFRYLDGEIKVKEKPNKIKNGRPKGVICTLTGKTWRSVRQCAIENNIPVSTLRGKLNGTDYNNTNFKHI